jgi:hypothetical protein
MFSRCLYNLYMRDKSTMAATVLSFFLTSLFVRSVTGAPAKLSLTHSASALLSVGSYAQDLDDDVYEWLFDLFPGMSMERLLANDGLDPSQSQACC